MKKAFRLYHSNNKNGFTLVEVMITATVLMIAILGVSSFYADQVKQEKKLSTTLEIKTILDSTISFVSASPEEYSVVSPLQTTSPNPFAMYVFCMTKTGMVVQNQMSGFNSTAIIMQGTDINARAVDVSNSNLAVCSTANAQVEIHMSFTDAYVANIVALELPPVNLPSAPVKMIGNATALLNAQLGIPTKID